MKRTSADSYERQVYAAILGKVIGVYMGRPVEAWKKKQIEERWGVLDHYVHSDCNVPMVVPDDDISGTLTFIRALEDSGMYADTPDDFFGKTWLNYLIENRTILWWGGMGLSTEHTAFLRLKSGIPSPQSGSKELNGKVVSEQIGAQIFIDGFGLVCPGRPELAAELARKAARVSHDGEAVYAAMVVAAMEAAAFEEKSMEKLLDIGVSFIPADSLIAQVHRDVRRWCSVDKDWHQTFQKIEKHYGYEVYGGNCHVIPNHALMVLAWSYAPCDFHEAQIIVNTCGWDTDCNAANVGCLMALVAGLENICRKYDYRTPFMDRILIPGADGTRTVSDCLTEARKIARIGRRIMGFPEAAEEHWFDFGQPGAAQGLMAETASCGVKVEPCTDFSCGKGGMFRYEMAAGGKVRISMPMLPPGKAVSSYESVGTGKLYPGMNIRAAVKQLTAAAAGKHCEAQAALYVTYTDNEGNENSFYSSWQSAGEGEKLFELTVPCLDGALVRSLGLEVRCECSDCSGVIEFGYIDFAEGEYCYQTDAATISARDFSGWIVDCDRRRCAFSDDREEMYYLIKNKDRGFAYTGNKYWKDQSIEARVSVHMAEAAGVCCCFQGMERYISLTRRGGKLVLAEHFYGEKILAECDHDWPLDEVRLLKLECTDGAITASVNGRIMLSGTTEQLRCGAAGFVFEKGGMGFSKLVISGKVSKEC